MITSTDNNSGLKRGGRACLLALLTGLTAGLSLLAVKPAAAQSHYVMGMPDFDQRSYYFPNVGLAYCVPTALTDELFYLSQNGYPKVVNNLTPNNQIVNMAIMLNTSPYSGCAFNDTLVANYINMNYPDAFTVRTVMLGNNIDLISTETLYKNLVYSHMVMLSYGFYGPAGPDANSPRWRNGGHFVALNYADVPLNKIGTRDPFVDETQFPAVNIPDLALQSPFHDEIWSPVLDGMPYRYMNDKGRLETLPNYLNYAFKNPNGVYDDTVVDGYSTIVPTEFLTATKNLTVGYYNPYGLPGTHVPKAGFFESTAGTGIVDLDFHPTLPKAAVVFAGSNEVMQLDLPTGDWSVLATANSPRQALYGGRKQNLYLREAERILAFDLQGAPIAQVVPARHVDAIGFDERAQRLVAVSLAARQVSFYTAELRLLGSMALPPVPGTGELTLSVQSSTGTLWLHRDSSRSIVGVGYDPATGSLLFQTLELQSSRSPRGLTVSDSGRLYVSDGGAVAEYDPSGRRSHQTRFDGLPAGRLLKMTHSFSNADPETMTGPEWRQIMPGPAR